MLVGASLLFLDFTGSVHAWLGWIAEIQFVPAVLAVNLGAVIALVLLTFVTGRRQKPGNFLKIPNIAIFAGEFKQRTKY